MNDGTGLEGDSQTVVRWTVEKSDVLRDIRIILRKLHAKGIKARALLQVWTHGLGAAWRKVCSRDHVEAPHYRECKGCVYAYICTEDGPPSCPLKSTYFPIEAGLDTGGRK